ncbi:putative Ccc1 family protein [Helianthus annuus]|uniref:Ccc1 family protein n=1 Tax=Helianthus annuus TaxID=4232 RepID=A0A251TG47_HELAN|nr:membrane protein of ER body-like protein [Helianthus annuus]KAF5784747.1 putative Ccc1 family protein [Helianthus annuus]KAJ0519890.1 putative Ccc1 family protein [Helianthus annuus]KAJ0882154.1 putative Ccc1 family protein [Helianthus annuus]
MANEGWEQLLLGAEQWRPEVKEGAEPMVMSDQAEVVEEEVVKLEFEKVKPKLATHSMHCPNCRSEITKVILRRKVYRPNEQDPVVVRVPPEPEQKDLVRCFSCSEIGCFNPFDIFQKSPETVNVGSAIIIVDEPETIVTRSRGRMWLGYEGILAEILKSIVYGGLMEVIASLSVVVSAAASNVTTLSIVSLALASLIGGVFIVGHNLWDLRNDCYKNTSSQETKKATTYKYKALLGQVNHFPLHAFFAILSFLVFGMVPPIAYRYSYHETKDKEYTLAVVALASLLCVLLLAILKAYINKCTVFKYFKTTVYYIIIAVLVSGVSYVVGNLVARLLEEPGWFATSSSGGMPCVPRVTSSYLESF